MFDRKRSQKSRNILTYGRKLLLIVSLKRGAGPSLVKATPSDLVTLGEGGVAEGDLDTSHPTLPPQNGCLIRGGGARGGGGICSQTVNGGAEGRLKVSPYQLCCRSRSNGLGPGSMCVTKGTTHMCRALILIASPPVVDTNLSSSLYQRVGSSSRRSGLHPAERERKRERENRHQQL